MSQISLQDAIDMTTRYRNQRNSVLKAEYAGDETLINCETFDKGEFAKLINQTGCEKVRIYFGMDEKLSIRTIFVGVNSMDQDMVGTNADVEEVIVENGLPCPSWCPPPSPLNQD
jgi:hypothetical protein